MLSSEGGCSRQFLSTADQTALSLFHQETAAFILLVPSELFLVAMVVSLSWAEAEVVGVGSEAAVGVRIGWQAGLRDGVAVTEELSAAFGYASSILDKFHSGRSFSL